MNVSNMNCVMYSRMVLGIHRSFREQDGVVLRHNPELVKEGVVPDFLHVIPIRDEIVRDEYFRVKTPRLFCVSSPI